MVRFIVLPHKGPENWSESVPERRNGKKSRKRFWRKCCNNNDEIIREGKKNINQKLDWPHMGGTKENGKEICENGREICENGEEICETNCTVIACKMVKK